MMKKMTVQDAVNAVGGQFYGTSEQGARVISSVVIDSRKIQDGTLFVAIPGERVDGHDFIPQVLANGAAASISEKELPKEQQPYILVEDTKKALRDLAQYYRNILDVKIVGITGSVGKTSTKEMMASVLSEKYSVQKTAGNFNNEIGLPLTIFSIGTEHEVGVVEMGISDFGEMTRLAMIARPDIMVITNIGQCHLENLKTRDGILQAKTECLSYLNDGGAAVFNGMDDKLVTIKEVGGKTPYYFGVKMDELAVANNGGAFEQATLSTYAKDIKGLGLMGSDATICFADGSSMAVHVPVAGSHMVMNASAAAMVAKLLDMSNEQIKAGIEKAEAVSGRGRQIQTEQYLLVDDCYNANPVSMKAEIDLLKESKGRKVAILGDMFELGANEKELHYEVGAYAVDKCDVLICIGALSEHMAQGAKDQKSEAVIYHFADRDGFLATKDDILKKGDTILLKASHGMNFTELLAELMK